MANCIIFEILNILLIIGGVFMMILKSSDKCGGEAYGIMVSILAVICILSGIVELGLHTFCFFHYQANKKLPFMSDSGEKADNTVKPNPTSNAPP